MTTSQGRYKCFWHVSNPCANVLVNFIREMQPIMKKLGKMSVIGMKVRSYMFILTGFKFD